MSERPNREIDALIAEKVMGWKWFQGSGNNDLLDPGRERAALALGMLPGRNPERGTTPSRLPHYSTDSVESNQLVNAMRERGYAYSITDDREDMRIEARFRKRGMALSCSLFIALEETREMAVALAALRAIGVELPEGMDNT